MTGQSDPHEDFVFVSSDCPVTPGAEHIEVYFDILKNRIFFYCYGCGSTWLENPTHSDAKPFMINDVVSDMVRIPTAQDFEKLNLQNLNRISQQISPDISKRLVRNNI